MRKIFLLGILILVIIFLSFNIIFKPKIKDTFPFSKADNVELIFYKGPQMGGFNLNELYKIPFSAKVNLNEIEKEEVFKIFYNENCIIHTSAECYEPRHALVFKNNNDTLGIIEVCLECSQIRVSEGIEQMKMCEGMVLKLDKFFKSKQ
jgi:hypothetical protein